MPELPTDTSISFGYGIELPIDQYSGSHAIEIFSPNVISGSELGATGYMEFDIENHLTNITTF